MQRNLWRSAIVLQVALLGGACGCQTKAEPWQLQAFLMKPRAPVSATEYRIYPPDVITISSMYVPEINGETQQLRPDGKVNLPLVGEVEIVGKTPKEVEALLIKKAGDYYEHADATVRIAAYNSQKIFVFGQVGMPGPQPWTGRDTLLDVLARVQPTPYAWPEKIKVIRAKPPRRGGYEPLIAQAEVADVATTGPAEEATAASAPAEEATTASAPAKEATTVPAEDFAEGPTNKAGAHEIVIDLTAMIETGDMSRNILLKPDDVIFVPPNPFAAVGLALQNVLFPVRPVLEAVRVPASVQGATSTGN